MKSKVVPLSLKVLAVLSNLSLARALHYLLMVFFGFLISLSLTPLASTNILNNLFLSMISVFFAFESSVLLNDLSDSLIDKENKKRTPLVLGVLTKNETASLALASIILSLIIASFVSANIIIFICISLLLSLAYNFSPLRLKRFAFISTFVLGLISITCILIGFVSTNNLIINFPTKYALLVLTFVTLCFGVKDLKDIRGDKLHKINSLPVLIGEGKSRIVFSILIAFCYLFSAIIASSGILLILAIAFSVANFFLLVKLKSNEMSVLLCYLVFSVFFCFFALF